MHQSLMVGAPLPVGIARMDYAIKMISECGLTPQDMWMPGK